MQELTNRDVIVTDSFWSPRLAVNAKKAIFHQWEQLEATCCIDNFRLAAGEKDGFREGWFFADSDAYKWLDAASRILARHADPGLTSLIDPFIALLGRAQMLDGYMFTYNQIHFPGQRWINLQIEHELYCHGHLIEAGVSHYEATGRRDLLALCIKSADLLVRDFLRASNDKTCGHEEIEIALIRLYHVTAKEDYLELARRFVERRGRIPLFARHLLSQFRSYNLRKASVTKLRRVYLADHPEYVSFRLPPGNYAKKPRFSRKRWYLSALLGLYAQQHTPIREQTAPVGHSVRFGYLETAIAMLCRSKSDCQSDLLPTLEKAWERMVTRRMYITGGLGSAPEIEGFGNDYDLDPELAYAETCASIASLLWNWEMALLTKNPRYSDLFEWQLYNATNVGMGQTGDTYLYNNPLAVHGGVTRQAWYVVPAARPIFRVRLPTWGNTSFRLTKPTYGFINTSKVRRPSMPVCPCRSRSNPGCHGMERRSFTSSLKRKRNSQFICAGLPGVLRPGRAKQLHPVMTRGAQPMKPSSAPGPRTVRPWSSTLTCP